VRRQVPPNVVDAYRVEAILRTAEPGRANLVVAGDSTARTTLDPAAFDAALAGRGLRRVTVSIGGTPTVAFGLLADRILALDPHAVILFVSPPSVSGDFEYDRLQVYDAGIAPALFTTREALDHFEFHLESTAAQGLLLLRHRWAMQRALAVRLGWTTWAAIELETTRAVARRLRHAEGGPLVRWVRDRRPDRYPNPNTRAIAFLGRRLVERDTRFVLVEAPIHPLFALLVAADKLRAFRDTMRELAVAADATFVPATEMPALEVEEFEDQAHLNARGQRLVTDALVARLAGVL